MSANHAPALRAIALHAARMLARYERHVRRLAATWLDMELYRNVSQEIDDIRLSCAAIPELTVPWTALLVSHSDLVYALWHGAGTRQGPPRDAVDHKLQEHLERVDALARRCVALARTYGEAGS
jgi:hypothetical protein